MGQTQSKSFAQRVVEAAERKLAEDTKQTEPEVSSDAPETTTEVAAPGATTATEMASVPDVDGADVSKTVGSDVDLLRDQLSLVVTNFRDRLDTHDRVFVDLESKVASLLERHADLEKDFESVKIHMATLLITVSEHEDAIEAIVKAVESLA
jgi:hypothetical protein